MLDLILISLNQQDHQYEVQHSQEHFIPEESQGAAGDILNENDL